MTIGGRRYVDGGLRSFTNMDLVAGSGLDLVIVSAPMSQGRVGRGQGRHPGAPTPAGPAPQRGLCLAAGWSTVVTIEPDRQVAHAMGLNPMDARPRGEVSRVARARVADWLAGSQTGRRLVAMLAGAVTAVDAVALAGDRTAEAEGDGAGSGRTAARTA